MQPRHKPDNTFGTWQEIDKAPAIAAAATSHSDSSSSPASSNDADVRAFFVQDPAPTATAATSPSRGRDADASGLMHSMVQAAAAQDASETLLVPEAGITNLPLAHTSSLQRFSPAKRLLSTFWSTVVCEPSVMRSGLECRMSLSISRVFVPNSTSISRYLSKAGQSHRRFNARSHSYGCFVVGTNVIFPAVVPVGKSNSVFVVTWLRS